MKQIKIYGLENCQNCKSVSSELEKLVKGTDIELIKRYCADEDKECDELEEDLCTTRYPMVLLTSFSYLKDKFNKPMGIVYICNNTESNINDSQIVRICVSDILEMINKIKNIVK